MEHRASNWVLWQINQRPVAELDRAGAMMQLIRPEAREVGQLLQDEDGAAEVEQVDLCAGQSTPNKGKGLRLAPSQERHKNILQHALEVDLLRGRPLALRHAPVVVPDEAHLFRVRRA